nr:CoA transferase [Actinomycetota bacterium]
LIYCSATAYGQTGPYSDRPGLDLILQGMSGLMSITGEPDGPPVKVGVPICDLTAALAGALAAAGHGVRGTTRDEAAVEGIAATGAEAVVADPDRLSTLLPHLDGVNVLCWLMGTVVGDAEAIAALHGPRLASIVETLVDTHVRGVVYEAAGSVERERLEEGARVVRELGARHRMPVEAVDVDPADTERWLGAMTAAVERVLGPDPLPRGERDTP